MAIDSLEKTVREALSAFVDAMGLLPEPTVIQTEEPSAPAKRVLPTFGIRWGVETWRRSQKSVVGQVGDRAVWDLGELEVEVGLVWRCASEEDAEAFRSQFRRKFFLVTVAAETDASVVEIAATYFDTIDDGVTLMLRDAEHYASANPRDTATVDYWTLVYGAVVTLPLLVLEEEPGTGIMDVLIVGGQADIDPFNLNDRHPEEV